MLKQNIRLFLLFILTGSVLNLQAQTEPVQKNSADLSSLRVTEIHYHPLDVDTTNDDEYEFIELKNVGQTELVLTGAAFVNGIDYTFTEGSIPANSFVIIASNAVKFKELYNFDAYGEYEGQLDNGGERITLVSSAGDTVINFKYSDDAPWPVEADGLGYSLVSKSRSGAGDPDTSAYWVISGVLNGSPGADDVVSGVKDITGFVPSEYKLQQNYPNPFNPVTNISYTIPETGLVSLTVYDVTGQEIAELINEEKPAGNYNTLFNASGLASGVYYYQVKVNDFISTKKMILLK
jgi:hypothetical protein